MTKEEMLKDLWKEVMKVRRKVKRAPDPDWYISTVDIKEFKFDLENGRDPSCCHLDYQDDLIHLAQNRYGCFDGDVADFPTTPCLCYQEISPGQWVKREHLPYQFDHEEALARIEGEG